jgi:hypothetical protein
MRQGNSGLGTAKRESMAIVRCAAVAAMVLLSACGTTETVNHASRFATAGIGYADSLPPVYGESFDAAVTAGSVELEQARRRLDPQTRLAQLREQDKLLEEQQQLLRALHQRSLLLRSYFIAIKTLAEADDATAITQSAHNTVARLQALRPAPGELTIAGRPVSELVGPAVNFGVAAYKGKALREELQARAPAIERELALQKAILRALADQMAADIALQVEIDERRPLAEAYASPANPDAPLPSTWRAQRLASFHRAIRLESIEVAAKAADNMHQSWIALAEGVLSGPSVDLLIQDVENLIQLAQALKGNS